MRLHRQIWSFLVLPSSTDYTSCMRVSSLWEWTSKRKLKHLERTASPRVCKERALGKQEIRLPPQETLLELYLSRLCSLNLFLSDREQHTLPVTKSPSLKAARKAMSLIYIFWTEEMPCICLWVYTCMSKCVFNVSAAMQGGCGQCRAC